MKTITRREFGRKTAHAVFFQMGILLVGMILVFTLLSHLIERSADAPATTVFCMLLLLILNVHFLCIMKYCRHIHTIAQISKLADIDRIAIVSCEQIQYKRKQWQDNWNHYPEQFRLIAPLFWVNRCQNCCIAGQAAYATLIDSLEDDRLHLADYAVRDDLIELDGQLCTVSGYLEFLGLVCSHTRLEPPISYKKGPAEKGFL